MTGSKEAVLFYRGGQVKFTRQAVDNQYVYQEEFFVCERLPVDDPISTSLEIKYKFFHRRGDTELYAIFEEV